MCKRFFSLILMLLLIPALLGGCAPAAKVEVPGVVENLVVSCYPEIAGKVVSSPVELGQTVATGDVLAYLDTQQEEYLLAQLQSTLKKRQTTLDKLLRDADSVAVEQIQNKIATARQAVTTATLTRDKTSRDLNQTQQLVAGYVLPRSALTEAETQAELAAAALKTAETQLSLARQELRRPAGAAAPEDIAKTAAEVEQLEDQIRQSEYNIARATVTAPTDGVLLHIWFFPGDMVSPGNYFVEIENPANIYVAADWPADKLALLAYDKPLTVKTPSGGVYQGFISFIDTEVSEDQINTSTLPVKLRLAPDTPLVDGDIVTVGE